MVFDWLKRMLGIDEIKNRVSQLEAEKRILEDKVIDAEQKNELVRRGVLQDRLSSGVSQYLESVELQLAGQESKATLVALGATELVDRYCFARYVAPIDQAAPSPVISLRDLQEHPERYLPRLSKGFMGFPVGLNFDSVNEILSDRFGNIQIDPSSGNSNNGTFSFVTNSLIPYSSEGRKETHELLLAVANYTQLNRTKSKTWIYMDSLDFLANYDGLERFFAERPSLDAKAKKQIISALQLVKFAYLVAMEVVGTTRIRDASELLTYEDKATPHSVEQALAKKAGSQQDLKSRLKESLLYEPKGTSYVEIQSLLPIASKERFRELASERTSEILASDKRYKQMSDVIGKPLEDYTVGESILLACYFARHIIQRYETLEDAVQNTIGGKREEKIGGKCTDFTALALHYLREFLVPLNPDKFRDWRFGFDTDKIGNYNHCYIKAIHVNLDQSVDVYFLDPTQLANKGLKELKTPKAVAKAMNTENLPLQIERVAEDLLYRPSE